MKTGDMQNFCIHFYNSTFIPIRYYESNEMIIQLPETDPGLDPFRPFYNNLFCQPQNVTYLITKQFVYYGIVKVSEQANNCFIIGPITNTPTSKDTIREIMLESSLSLNHINEFTDLFNKSPIYSFDRFLQTLCFINYCINHETRSIDTLLDYKNQKTIYPIAMEHTTKIYHAKENQQLHNTYQFEKQYLSIIENGDLASLRKLLDSPVIITPGVVADNSIRQTKNLFIACITLVTRAAIKGGLDMESAYQLSDIYIQQMEKLQSLEAIFNLQYQVLFDFTERVFASKIPSGLSHIVYECINFINANTNQAITVEDVADHVKKSRSFISRKFKQELGFGINEFINSRKIEEAKYLMTYTDKSISEISSYLCFSSQSYFQNVFKKKLGMTPNEYRSKHLPMKDIYNS